MASQKWTILDTKENISLLDQDFATGHPDITLSSHLYQGGLSDGVSSLNINNGVFSFEVLLTRGLSIHTASYQDIPLGWQSPIPGPVHPKFINLYEPSGLGWLDGFDEFLVRCGLESNGAPEFNDQGHLKYPLHGKIGNLPAHYAEIIYDEDQQEITINGLVDETRFHFSKLRLSSTIKTKVGEPGFRIHDQVENLSASSSAMQMLYHANFGPPVLEKGSQVFAPIKTLIPRNHHAASDVKTWDTYQTPQAGYEEQVYFLELLSDQNNQTQVLLKNSDSSFGVSTRFDITQLPYLTVWKNTTDLADGYVTGIEPGTNFPNPRSFEQKNNRTVKLAPHNTVNFNYQLEVHSKKSEVSQAEQAITKIQSSAKPNIFSQPKTKYCIDA